MSCKILNPFWYACCIVGVNLCFSFLFLLVFFFLSLLLYLFHTHFILFLLSPKTFQCCLTLNGTFYPYRHTHTHMHALPYIFFQMLLTSDIRLYFVISGCHCFIFLDCFFLKISFRVYFLFFIWKRKLTIKCHSAICLFSCEISPKTYPNPYMHRILFLFVKQQQQISHFECC